MKMYGPYERNREIQFHCYFSFRRIFPQALKPPGHSHDIRAIAIKPSPTQVGLSWQFFFDGRWGMEYAADR